MASLALLITSQALPAHAQADYPTISFLPATPISTEPFAIIFTSSLPDGTSYFVTVYGASPPHVMAGSCQAIQKNGIATCMLGRIAPGFYTTSVSGDRYIQPFNFNILSPGPSTISALQGQYAFLVRNQSSGSPVTPTGAAVSGSFTADGQGNITAGVMDVNSIEAAFQNLPITGTYTLDAVGQGTISLKTSQGTVSLAVVVPTRQTVLNVTNANLVALPGSLVAGDGILVNQSGLLQSSSPISPGFVSTLNGGYQATLAGEFSPQALPIGGALQFSFSTTGSVASAGQLTVGGSPISFAGLSGTYTPVNGTTGRTTFTLSAPGQPQYSFAAYETSEQSFFYLSLAPHASNPLLAGTATQ